MSHPQPPQRQPTPNETENYVRAVHYAAIGVVIACPILALLPPRKLDFYTIGLLTTTGYCSNYLLREQTGRSIWQHVTLPSTNVVRSSSVIPAEERANLNRELQHGRQEMQRVKQEGKGVMEELSGRDAWKKKLEEEIKEEVAAGKGYWDVMYDQIYEVWNWSKRKDDDED